MNENYVLPSGFQLESILRISTSSLEMLKDNTIRPILNGTVIIIQEVPQCAFTTSSGYKKNDAIFVALQTTDVMYCNGSLSLSANSARCLDQITQTQWLSVEYLIGAATVTTKNPIDFS